MEHMKVEGNQYISYNVFNLKMMRFITAKTRFLFQSKIKQIKAI